MHYIEMTIEEANEYYKGTSGKTVLVAVQDLERNEEQILSFTKKNRSECENILMEAETIVRVCDDFVNQLRAFTKKQPNVREIIPKGRLNTILLKE